MTRRHISTGSPFELKGGYSRAVVQEPWVFVSGTTGYDYTKMVLPEGVTAQTHQCFNTISAVLNQCGSSLQDVVRVNYVVSSRDYVEEVLEIAGQYFAGIRPAAMIIVAGLLEEAMLVEIEVTAVKR